MSIINLHIYNNQKTAVKTLMNLIPFLFCEMGFSMRNGVFYAYPKLLSIVKRGKAYIMLKFKGMIIALDKKGTTYNI
ncbi:hypothetical protein CN563_15210 [Bacillus sp. AFS026049]|nr:hypothetical protein CN563_15210 [Bacillus sp. AFS026049]